MRPTSDGRVSKMRERWVVISNCQTYGLARAIEAVGHDIDCDGCDVWKMGERLAADPDYFRQYDFALVMPDGRGLPGFPTDALPAHADVPAFLFGGYHPDCCYVYADGVLISDGYVGPYHSMIALAAYKEKMRPAEAVRWFNPAVYRKAGYHLMWEAQRDHLIFVFGHFGLDIGPLFRKLGRGRSFMHTIDHPKIDVLMEIARIVMRSLDRPVDDHAPPPPDELAITNWPIYPEIGELLGVAGAYRFRPANQYPAIGLEDYLEQAFAIFGRWDRSRLRVTLDIQPRLLAIRQAMREGQ